MRKTLTINMKNHKLYQRYLRSRVGDALADKPVVLIHGPRQSGKTTLAQLIELFLLVREPALIQLGEKSLAGEWQRGDVVLRIRKLAGDRLKPVPPIFI